MDLVVALLDRHLEDAKVQKQGCWAVLTLAGEDAMSLEMMERGIPAAVANAMVRHSSDAAVQRFAGLAFSNMADAGADVRRKLRVAGVPEVRTPFTISIIIQSFEMSIFTAPQDGARNVSVGPKRSTGGW